MKSTYCIFSIAAMLFATAAVAQVDSTSKKRHSGKEKSSRYTDITNGRVIDLQYNVTENLMYDRKTNKSVDFFINGAGDTISSRGFYVVNNYLSRTNDGYSVDTSKLSMRGEKMWGTKSNKELDRDKNWKQYRSSSDSANGQP